MEVGKPEAVETNQNYKNKEERVELSFLLSGHKLYLRKEYSSLKLATRI
ncbi:MAG: hypothetical protein U9M98_01535 [Patescibacteria group bacterium]|nr:hypothetical protein [Patescibacteria group bacterium]